MPNYGKITTNYKNQFIAFKTPLGSSNGAKIEQIFARSIDKKSSRELATVLNVGS